MSFALRLYLFTVLSVIGTAFPSFAEAANYRLFNSNKEPITDYQSTVEGLKPGDVIEFSNRKSFTIQKYLGQGGFTRIYQISDNQVIRIPKRADYGDFIQQTIDGYKALKQNHVDVVEIYESLSDEYVVARKIDIEFLAEDLKALFEGSTLSAEKKEFYLKKLKDWLMSTGAFNDIGDFQLDQLAFDRKLQKFVLFDWINDHTPHYLEFSTQSLASICLKRADEFPLPDEAKPYLKEAHQKINLNRLEGLYDEYFDCNEPLHGF